MPAERRIELQHNLHTVRASALLGAISSAKDFSERFSAAIPNANQLRLSRTRINEVVPSGATYVRTYRSNEIATFIPNDIDAIPSLSKDGKPRFYMTGVLHVSGLYIDSPFREQSTDVFTIPMAQVVAYIHPNRREQEGYLFEAWRSAAMPASTT